MPALIRFYCSSVVHLFPYNHYIIHKKYLKFTIFNWSNRFLLIYQLFKKTHHYYYSDNCWALSKCIYFNFIQTQKDHSEIITGRGGVGVLLEAFEFSHIPLVAFGKIYVPTPRIGKIWVPPCIIFFKSLYIVHNSIGLLKSWCFLIVNV